VKPTKIDLTVIVSHPKYGEQSSKVIMREADLDKVEDGSAAKLCALVAKAYREAFIAEA